MLMDYKGKKEDIGKNKHFIRSVEFAVTGIKTVYHDERNMRAHTILGGVAIVLGLLFQLNRWEWLWLLLSIFLVIVMEIINTAFENVVDMITDFHFHSIGKKVKDMAAGAVLITALFALIVACFIFLPKIYQLFF